MANSRGYDGQRLNTSEKNEKIADPDESSGTVDSARESQGLLSKIAKLVLPHSTAAQLAACLPPFRRVSYLHKNIQSWGICPLLAEMSTITATILAEFENIKHIP